MEAIDMIFVTWLQRVIWNSSASRVQVYPSALASYPHYSEPARSTFCSSYTESMLCHTWLTRKSPSLSLFLALVTPRFSSELSALSISIPIPYDSPMQVLPYRIQMSLFSSWLPVRKEYIPHLCARSHQYTHFHLLLSTYMYLHTDPNDSLLDFPNYLCILHTCSSEFSLGFVVVISYNLLVII